jgi:transketolase
LKPIDQEAIVSVAARCGAVVTIEENNIVGGLGSAVAEVLSESHPVPILRLGIPDRFGESASQDQLWTEAGLTVENVVHLAKRALFLKGDLAGRRLG